ncbi:MAG: hypothetical protein ACLQDY_09965 [Streptosporangiaceae bacterium]
MVAALALTAAAAAPGLIAHPAPARAGAMARHRAVALTGTGLTRDGAAPAEPMAAGSPPGQRVLMINGDQLAVRPGPGGPAVSLLARPGATGGLLGLRAAGRAYWLPADALPYLGHGLDPSLFDAAALARAETGSRLPVRLTFSGRRPRLPGITITRTRPGAASGYLTAASARVFGTALARQYAADHSRASYGAGGLFASGLTIALPGARTAVRPRPGFRLHTLTVTATDLHGRPDTGDVVFVLNVDNSNRFGDPIENLSFFYHGIARFSVPAGHYWAVGDFYRQLSSTRSREHTVVLPQFTVHGHHATVHMAERSASIKLAGASTPRPSVLGVLMLSILRTGRHGPPVTFIAGTWPGSPLWVSPTARRPSVGTLRAYFEDLQNSPQTAAGMSYGYNLAFAGPPGIIAQEHLMARPASLATVRERFYQDFTSRGGTLIGGGSTQDGADGDYLQYRPLRLPGRQTEYFSAGPDNSWNSAYYQIGSDLDGAGGQYETTNFSYRAGQQLTDDWGRYPLHPQPDVQLLHGLVAAQNPSLGSAIRAGNKLVLVLTPFSDNQPGHLSNLAFTTRQTSGSYAVYQDGRLVGHGNPSGAGAIAVRLSSRRSAVRLDLSTRLPATFGSLSAATSTEWTWRTRRQPQAVVPPSWYCSEESTAPFRYLRRCAAQPLLDLDYQVHGLALDGTTAPGRQVIGLAVGHVPPARGASVTDVAAWASGNGGRTWRRAAVTRTSRGRFRLSFTAAGGTAVTLRVAARDAAGGSVTETIQRAYAVRAG